jgi:PAS domain S-box-containing protein
MSAALNRRFLDGLRRSLSAAEGLPAILQTVVDGIVADLGADEVRVVWRHGNERIVACNRPMPGASPSAQPNDGRADLRDDTMLLGGQVTPGPLAIHDVGAARMNAEALVALSGVRSYALLPVYVRGRIVAVCECIFTSRYHRWERDQLAGLGAILDLMTIHAERFEAHAGVREASDIGRTESAELKEARHLYEQLIDLGNMLFLRTDGDLLVVDVQGNYETLLGMTREEILGSRAVWRQFLTPPAFRRAARRLSATPERREISEEIGLVNRKTGETRWLLLKGIPLLDSNGEFRGWEGLGLDITERHRIRDEATRQTKRVEALYEVSRSLQVTLEPASMTLKGLRALVSATGSNCGLGCFYDASNDKLELVASEGLSATYLESFERILNGPTLIRRAVEGRQGFIVNDVQLDPRAAVDLARMEGLRATIIVPLVSDGQVIGALALFCRRANQYNEDDFELISAAARQIALSVRQAALHAAQRREADSLAALYRLSHELTKHLTPAEVAAHAFPIIQEELACRRLWLGVINDQGTHIIGQAGVGPGVRRSIVDAQIDLAVARPQLDRALRSKVAVVMKPGDVVGCPGFERVMAKLEIGGLIIVPLVTLGQVVGVLLVEPAISSAVIDERKVTLLTAMGSEIATVIMARRFESRMAESEKMRMAGLLASGVAHNFNNMLQAVMGQASLIEMQSTRESPVGASARMIVEAASKGAGLIKQLMNFSMQGTAARRNLSLERLVQESADLYKSVIGSGISLEIDIAPQTPEVYADYGQLQQVMTNLLMNAREAIGERTEGQVRLQARPVTLRSGEIDRELAPGEYVRIDVEDNGGGMDAESVVRCFEPFYTTKNVDVRTGVGLNGSGLGLSSAYSIVKHHEGLITVRSRPGAGSVFSIYLPVAPILEGRKELSAVARDGESHVSVMREAIVYNLEATVERAVVSTIDSQGMQAVLVRSSDEVIRALNDGEREIQLVVLDVDRCEAEVRGLITAIRRARDRIKILCSTTDRVRWSKDLATIPGVEVVEKPLGVWTLTFHVRRALKSPLTGGLVHRVVVKSEEVGEHRLSASSPLEGYVEKGAL